MFARHNPLLCAARLLSNPEINIPAGRKLYGLSAAAAGVGSNLSDPGNYAVRITLPETR
jgi:hypothetical protein